MVRIALCDDHPIFREGLRRILWEQQDFSVEAAVGSGAELLQEAALRHLDVVVLDIALPEMSGLDVLKELQALRKRPAVLMLSMHPEEHYARRVLKAGAAGYLQKESPQEEVLKAIRTIAAGGRYVTSSFAQELVADLVETRDRAPHELLSDREYQVLCLLGTGKRTKEIAGSLGLSLATVSTYRARLFEKLGLSSTADLVRYAMEHGLV